MATRSAIGIELEDGSVKAVYCHWDGYPEYNGRILNEHYQDRDKILALIAEGDLSSLGSEIGTKHDFDERKENECTFYKRDRGETGVDADSYVNSKHYCQTFGRGIDYLYLFTKEGKWTFAKDGYPAWINLEDRLEVEEMA